MITVHMFCTLCLAVLIRAQPLWRYCTTCCRTSYCNHCLTGARLLSRAVPCSLCLVAPQAPCEARCTPHCKPASMSFILLYGS